LIKFERYTLPNGLTVILHPDDSTPLVTVNVLYKVGSKNEDPAKTGFAHLFEHLMFGGSANVADYDTPIQQAGGDSNAFTNSDLTNFYNVMPAENLEVALWLESDRMLQLDFNQKSLDVQKKVVVEEFKETSINQPYGDLWHELSSLAFELHPYKWPTIGLVPEHISEANLSDVKVFFERYYQPDNAVLVVAGKYGREVKEQVQKWFGKIPTGRTKITAAPSEPKQLIFKTRTIYRPVPADALYLAFHMPDRNHPDFIVYDILSDILSGGRSARLYQNLLKGSKHFSKINAYITGTMDPGLFTIEATFSEEADQKQAKLLIWAELEKLKTELIPKEELQKVKNSMISSVAFSEVSITHKAINLAYYEMLGAAEKINTQEEEIESVTVEDLMRIANEVFHNENCSELFYLRNKMVSTLVPLTNEDPG